MKLLSACCFFLLTALAVCQQTSNQIIGSWKYNTKTMTIAFNANVKKQIAKEGPGAEARIAQMKQSLAQQLSIMTVTFNKGGRMQVTMTGYPSALGGKWSMSGRKIKVVMDDKTQKSPSLELLPGGKQIRASFNQPSFGTGSVNLVKKT